VAVICAAPLMAEGVATALDGVADTRLLPTDLEDLSTLLRTLAPDAIVVDRECRAAHVHADQHGVPLFVVPVEAEGGDVPSPERLRALVVGSLLAVQVRA
jgi:hypothetical protein